MTIFFREYYLLDGKWLQFVYTVFSRKIGISLTETVEIIIILGVEPHAKKEPRDKETTCQRENPRLKGFSGYAFVLLIRSTDENIRVGLVTPVE